MRKLVSLAALLLLSASHGAAAETRPALASEPLYSAGSITDVDPAGTSEEAALYEALRSLIERYGVSGVNYADKTVRKDWTITAEEAKVPLLAFYAQLGELISATADSALADASDDDAAEVIKKFQDLSDKTLAPAASCQLLVGTKYAVPTKKAPPKALAGNANLSWAQALACLPGGGAMPLTARSYNLKAAQPGSAMTRGEFLHKLNEAADASMAEISLLM
jgi:hypothetical protein